MRPLPLGCLLLACGSGPMAGGDGEACSAPYALAKGMVTVEGSTELFHDDDGDTLSSCGGSGAPDVVFAFSAVAAQKVTVTVTTASDFWPIVKLRGAGHGCTDLDDRCNAPAVAGAKAQIADWTVGKDGTQYLIVDGKNGTKGPFTLQLQVQ